MIRFDDVSNARKRIQDFIVHTPCIASHALSDMLGAPVYLKLENMQATGSFKIRGAANKLTSCQKELGSGGVVAASAGNHAQGVAMMAAQLKIPCSIVMPEGTPLVKVSRTKSYGADVILHGENFDEAFAHAKEITTKKKAQLVHAFDDPLIMAGQGTIGFELLESIPPESTVVVPIGGGGLMGGIATVLKHRHPKMRIIGVQTLNSPNVGKRVLDPKLKKAIPTSPTIAEGIAVKYPSDRVVKYLHKLVDDVVFVSEEEIAQSILFLLEKEKTVTEGAGASGIAAFLAGKIRTKGHPLAIVVSGGNVDPQLLGSIIEHGLSLAGRLCGLRFIVDDKPGMLLKICQVVAENKGNVVQVYHHRGTPKIGIGQTEIDVHLETRGMEHQEKMMEKLGKAGYSPVRLF